jgi:hypothetical protein
MSGCSSIPGATGEEQVQTIDELVNRTLPDLYKQEPETQGRDRQFRWIHRDGQQDH